MPSYNWPRTGDCPQDTAKHASCLKNEFDFVSKAVDSSLSPSRSATLPSTLEPSILTGIEKGIAEARSKGYCPKWSKVDEIVFRNVMLKNIATEAALQIRDRVPLDQFNGLHKSYNALHTKLVAQLPPTATSHQSVRADAPTQATSVGALVERSHATNTAVKLLQASGKTVASPQVKREEDVTEKKSDDDSNEEKESSVEEEIKEEEREIKEEERETKEEEREIKEEERESEEEERKSQDAEDGQAVTDNDASETGSYSSEDSSSDSSSGEEEENEDDGESDSDADCDNDQVQEIVKENTARRAAEDSTRPSTTFKLEIKDQATVHRMRAMEPSELLRYISCSLKDHLGEKQLSLTGVRVSAASLLDSGDVNVAICQNTHLGPSIICDLKCWGQKLERTLIGSPVLTYPVLMHGVQTNSLIFRSWKEKSEIIRKLVDENRLAGDEAGMRPIRDIYWAKDPFIKARALASLIVEFVDPEQANQVLVRGLSWQKRRHGCHRADEEGKLLRCGRCQAYGHLEGGGPKECKAPFVCGKCAGPHDTRTCKSKISKCASCGGSHHAGDTQCPEKLKARKMLEFKPEKTAQSIKLTSEVDRAPSSVAQRSMSAGKAQTEASLPSPVSLDAESAGDDAESEAKRPLPEVKTAKDNVKSKSKQSLPQVETAKNNVKSKSKQSLPQADAAQDTSAELGTLRREFEDIKKQLAALNTILQSNVSGGTKRRADEAFVNGAKAESSGIAAKRIKQEEPTHEEAYGLYRHPSLYSDDR